MAKKSSKNKKEYIEQKKLLVEIRPLGPIRGPIDVKDNPSVINIYIRAGWVRPEDIDRFRHVDKVFYRTIVNGKPKAILLKEHIHSPIKRAAEELGIDKKLTNFIIVDENNNRLNYAVIRSSTGNEDDDLPVIIPRFIRGVNSLENPELILPNHYVRFIAIPVDPKTFSRLLIYAGKNNGLYSKSGQGYAKFSVTIKDYQSNP